MLPNSRMIPPKNIRRRSNSAVTTSSNGSSNLSHEPQQQQQQKKGFISRLLSNPSTPKDFPSRPKYESVLGIHNDKDYAAWGKPIPIDNSNSGSKTTSSIKSSSSTGSGTSSNGFGKLFLSKKRGNNKTSIDNELLDQQQAADDLPKVRPIHTNSISRKHTKIPLAPPPTIITQKGINQQQFLSNLPDQYLAKRPTASVNQQQEQPQSQRAHSPQQLERSTTPTTTNNETRSTSSLRKSSGSYSIYSTFGGNESVYSVEAVEKKLEEQESVDSFNTVVTSVAHQQDSSDDIQEEEDDDDDDNDTTTTTTTITTNDEDSEDDDDDDDDDDAFVDATGLSQEDIKREEKIIENHNKNLSKRLSGGHFGSAGGLLFSMNDPPSPPPPVPSIQQQHKRKSKPVSADEELAKSMLNWKRHSDSSKRFSMRGSAGELPVDKHASTVTVIDLRSALTKSAAEETHKEEAEEEEEEELSVPDKMALRKKAEEALSGTSTPSIIIDQVEEMIVLPIITTTPPRPTTALPPPPRTAATPLTLSSLSTLSATNDEPTGAGSRISTAELFSKTLDDVWKTSDDDSLQLFSDERTKQLQSSIQNIEQTDKIEEKIKETALLLWKEDESIVSKERMAEWLGQGKPFHSAVLYHYMEYFYFSDMRLDSAFRKLCSKLYFKAEAQQIDRILESFANRYWDCNQNCLFGSADIVYAVVYSLLLLNTDLHVAQGNHARMTRSEFIRNTMSTVRDQRDHEESMLSAAPKRSRNWEAEVENYMKEMYMSVKQYQILQPLSRKTSLSKRGSIMGSKRVIGLKKSVNSIIRKSGRESMLVLDDQQQQQHNQSSSPTTPTSPHSPLPPPPRSSISSGYNRPMTPSSKSTRRDSFSSATSSSATSLSSRCGSPTPTIQQQPMIQYMNQHGSSLFSSRPPYFKEGVVMRKHLLENASQKARHREWRECFLEVSQENGGELRMYTLQQPALGASDKSLFRHSTAATFANNPLISEKALFKPSSSFHSTTKWSASSQLIGKISLSHTLSNPLPPPGYNRQRPHVFATQQSDGGVYLFQAASADQVQEWVSTCNYIAAFKSKEPLPGALGNMDYGWGYCLNDVILDLDAMRNGLDQKHYINLNNSDPDAIFIQDWLPPTATMVSSNLDERDQYEMLQKHLKDLNNEINVHRDMKAKILIKFPRTCNNYHKVLNNWEARSKYLLHDIIKYQNYCDALEKSLSSQPPPEEEQELQMQVTPLEFNTTKVDLFKEINQELFLSL